MARLICESKLTYLTFGYTPHEGRYKLIDSLNLHFGDSAKTS